MYEMITGENNNWSSTYIFIVSRFKRKKTVLILELCFFPNFQIILYKILRSESSGFKTPVNGPNDNH